MSARGGHSQGVASASSMQTLNKGLGKGTPPCKGQGESPGIYTEAPREARRQMRESNMRHPISVMEAIPVEALKDRRVASRSRSPRAPRGVLTGIWLDALYGAQQEFAENSIDAALCIRDGFYVSQGRLLRRAEQIMEAWKENKEARRSWRTRRRGRITFD